MEQTYAVIIPEGRRSGQQFQAILGGQLTLISIPNGSRAGDLIHVKIVNKINTPISSNLANAQINTTIIIQNDISLPTPINIPEDLDESKAPKHLLCPITECVMSLPVITPSGITYDYFALAEWLDNNDKDPISNSVLHIDQVYPNRILYLLIEDFVYKEWTEISC